VAADLPLDLESLLGTVPGLIYRSRLAPEPYTVEFVSDDRLEAIGGSLELESPAGGGTVVRARVPIR
jgi:hypothetical protein